MFHFHPIRSKQPPNFNFTTLGPVKYFYKIAATTGPNFGEVDTKFSKQDISCFFGVNYGIIGGKIGLCKNQHFPSYTKLFQMIFGPKLDRVN